jgi:hypothetical protein
MSIVRLNCLVLLLLLSVHLKIWEVLNETGTKVLLLLLPRFEPLSLTSYFTN